MGRGCDEWGEAVMMSLSPSSFSARIGAQVRSRPIAISVGHNRYVQLGAHNEKTFKTNPIAPSSPNGAARCAFARSGAQRAPGQKSVAARSSFTREDPE